MTEQHQNDELGDIEYYGDDYIASGNAKVSGWLKFNYILWPIWGIVWFYLFWNGSTVPWFDRGYWNELQKAANTTFPAKNLDDPSQFKNALESNTPISQ